MKFKAFTIIEMMVVMLLTAIGVSLAAVSYEIIQKQYYLYQSASREVKGLAQLHYLLKKDFAEAEMIRKDQQGITLMHLDKSIGYTFEPEKIIRSMPGMADTFIVKPENLKFNYSGIQQLIPGERVDEVFFEVNKDQQSWIFHYRKDYAADILIKEEEEY